MPITLRAATPEDVPMILTFIRELAEYERLADRVIATVERLQEMLFGARPYAEVILADVEGVPAGFALYLFNFSTFLAQPGIYLEDLFVRPPYRGHGVGRRLLTELARVAVERGCGRLEWSVLDWNEPAIGFYQRLGAKPQDDWTVYRLTGEALTALAASAAIQQEESAAGQ